MFNLQTDIIKKYLKLPLNTSWFIIFEPSLSVVNRYAESRYGGSAELNLHSFGVGSSKISKTMLSKKIVPNATLEFDERDTMKIIFNMEILH